ncbi:glycosyltransferase [uncultured Thiodictyon sp.]|uniref:glycosyltransferase n=1 Tax=uncultured Thiodictyon sp. TaxID=1846217 RepID=UPI0025DA36C8|nr:glycosyltransferase [uncultured Thiodictyon sp.]
MLPKIGGAIVTHNRAAALRLTLGAALTQTHPLSRLVLIDNASTDATGDLARQHAPNGGATLDYCRLTDNLGCSAGFAVALEQLLRSDCEWFWLLDDDATPAPDALEHLTAQIKSPLYVYCSAAIGPGGDDPVLCWPVAFRRGHIWSRPAHFLRELPDVGEVEFSSFLGMLIHRSLVEAIGFPDKGFFISGDDAEYSYRMRKHGAKILLIKSSCVCHPLPRRRSVKVFGVEIQVLEHPAWKRYYEIRNRLIIARRYHGVQLWTRALPGTLLRWLITLAFQPDRLAQSRAFARGIVDGLAERLGIRWPPP